MLIRRINNINGQRVKVDGIAVDPHGQLICIYDDDRSEFIIIRIFDILRHFLYYRHDFFTKNCYDNKERLPYVHIFKSQQTLEFISSLQFSKKYDSIQYIVVTYATCIEIVELHFDRCFISSNTMHKFGSEILKTTIINNDVFITLYNRSLAKISLKSQNKQKQQNSNQVKSINFITNEEQIAKGQCEFLELFPLWHDESDQSKIWQTISGVLMINSKIISRQFQQELNYTNSYEEYISKQINQHYPIKYEISPCQQYIVGCPNFNLNKPQLTDRFIIRAKWSEWSQIAEFSRHPIINPYWTYHQKYAQLYENWGDQKYQRLAPTKSKSTLTIDKIMFAYQISGQKQLIVSWLIVQKSTKKRIITNQPGKQTSKQQKQEQSLKYKGRQTVIMRVKNLKNQIYQIKWIGLNQLLYVEKDGQMYYLQFNEEYIK